MMKKKALVTAGPTYEPIDPVRFIGNHSSGKMGYSLAEELVAEGFEVFLISGPTSITPPKEVTFISIQSAQEMYDACLNIYKDMSVSIFAAAVADYTPKYVADKKIKKKDDEFSIDLIKTKDIAKEMGLLKQEGQINVGFALETDNELINAEKKLNSKNFDFVVLNSLRNEGTCFGSDHNKITILEHNKRLDFEFKPKKEVAKDIIKHILSK